MNLGTAVAYLDLNTSRWNSGFQSANQQMRTLGDSSQSMGTRFAAAGSLMQSTGRTLTTAVTLPLAGVAGVSIKTAADFESSMSRVQAVTGASGQDMKKLEGLAREMGATTKFSASDAADALNFMGMAGWKTQDMMDGLPGVLDLAAAGGTDLATTSDIVTDGLTGMGLTAKDTGMFVDVMAATMSNSNTNVELMGESLKYVGPVAGALGINMQDLSLAIGLMGNAGIKGSQAGTALRAGISNLIKPTDDAAATMEKYGVEIKKNSDGSVDFRGTMDNLRTSLGGLDETTQAAALSTIFGKEAMSGWAAIVNASEGDFNKLAGAIDNSSGKSKEMAAIMQDNLNGQLDNLKSALEEAAISIGNALLPAMKKLTEWIQKAVDWFNQLSPSMQSVILVVAGLAAAVGPLLLIFGSLAMSISALMPVFAAIGTAMGYLVTAFNVLKFVIFNVVVPAIRAVLMPALEALWALMLANPITLVIAAIAALVAAFVWCWNNVDGFKEFWINAWETIKQWCSDAIEMIKEKFAEWGENLNIFITETIPQFIEAVGTWFSQLPERIGTWLTTTIDNIGTWCSETWTMFTDWCSSVLDSIGTWFSELPNRIGFALGVALGTIATWCVDSWNYFATNVPLWMEAIGNWFSELPGKVWTWLVDTYNKVVTWGTNMWNKAMEVGGNFINAIVTWFQQLPGKIWQWLVDSYNKATTWANNMWQKAKEAGQKFIDGVIQWMQQLPGKVWQWLSNTLQKAAQFVNDMWQKGKDAAKKFGDAVVNGLKSIPGKVVSIGKSIVEGLWKGISGAGGWLMDKVSGFCSNVVSGFKSAFKINSPSKIMRDVIGVGIVEGIDVGIQREESSLLKTADNMVTNLTDTMSPGILDIATDLQSSTNASISQTGPYRSGTGITVHMENVNIHNDKDIEDTASEIGYYVQRKLVFG